MVGNFIFIFHFLYLFVFSNLTLALSSSLPPGNYEQHPTSSVQQWQPNLNTKTKTKKQSTNTTAFSFTILLQSSAPPEPTPMTTSMSKSSLLLVSSSDLDSFPALSQRRRHRCGHTNVIEGNHRNLPRNPPLTNTTNHRKPLLCHNHDNMSHSFSQIWKPHSLSRFFFKKRHLSQIYKKIK